MRLGDLDALEAEFVKMGTVLHSADTACAAAYVVNKATTVEAVPVVHGTKAKLVSPIQCTYKFEYHCPICEAYIFETDIFCSQCGAKMDL